MKIEVGKYYKTRGGKKAEIYKKITSLDIRESGYEGRVFANYDSCMNFWWALNGRHEPDGNECIVDLIEEWNDEREEFIKKIRPSIERYWRISYLDLDVCDIADIINKLNHVIRNVNVLHLEKE